MRERESARARASESATEVTAVYTESFEAETKMEFYDED